MSLDTSERKEIVSTTMERLSLVIGASGNAEELVGLVTQIVKAVRRLIEDTPEDTKTKGTSVLADFVFAAKKIAQDARAVDSNSLQNLSSKRKAVESFVKDLDSYYESHQESNDIDLQALLSQPSQASKSTEPVNGVGRARPTDSPVPTGSESRLTVELKKQQELLQSKSEPQKNPAQHGQPSEVLGIAMSGLQRATESLVEASSQKAPTKSAVLEPTVLLTKMVSMLIDLVDSLFVSKYPMRTQVHSFCCMLIDNALVYGEQSKSDDAASLRLISTQVPALMSALEVMVEQCYKRSKNIRESQKMSIQRGVDLSDLDLGHPGQAKSVGVKRRKDPPVPPSKAASKVHLPPPPPKGFDIVCMICTNVAVDSESKEILTKGSEIKLKVNEKTKVQDVRKILTTKTGLPFEHIQLRYRGDDVLLDETKVTPDNPLPYFMFNLFEPGEEEIQDFKRQHRRKLRMRIEEVDWSKVPSSVAVAIYDYQSLGDGEDDSLEFEEGELIEIIEKSADGWWTGKIDGKVGVIPASFVEEITVPQSKEEAKKLVKKFRQGKLGAESHTESHSENINSEDHARSHTSSPSPTTGAPSHHHHHHNPLSGVGKALRRIHSGGSHDYSKLGGRKVGEPIVKEKKDRKRGSLFKKRTVSQDPIMEYKEMPAPLNEQGSPLLSSPANRKHVNKIIEYSEEPQANFPPAVKRLSRPASSPRISRMADSKPQTGSVRAAVGRAPVGDSSLRVKRRPPPPPPPFQKTYPRRSGEDAEDVEAITMHVTPASPTAENPPEDDLPPIKSSASMEELFRNLEEFDELASPSSHTEGDIEGDPSARDFATIPRSELPPPKKESTKPPSPEMQNRLTVESVAPQKPPRRRSKKQEPPSSPAPPPPEAVVAHRSVDSGLHVDIVNRDRSESPLPQPPPRRKSRKLSEKREESNNDSMSPVPPLKPTSSLFQGQDSPLLSKGKSTPFVAPKPGKPSPAIPPKPKGLSKPIPAWRASLEKPACSSAPVSRTVSPDDQGRLSISAREASVSSELLTRSPVVMRRTNAVNASLDPEFSDDELEDCTGIGKEGVLHKEGAKKVEWKSRYFRILESCIDYFECALDADESPPLGQILVNRMQGAVPLGEKDGFQCFAINMKYDTSVVLGCHSRMDMDDWVKSINKMIKGTKSGEMIQTYSTAYQAALKSIEYLSAHVIEDRALIAASAPTSLVSQWLESVDKGQKPNLSKIPDATTAACLLRSLFKKGRLGSLIRHSLSSEICELTQSANPISILSSKLDKLSPEPKDLLKQLLRLFGKVLEYSHKNSTELEDLNRTFGPLLFEKMSASQTEPLLAYLISTCELIIS